MKTEKKVKKLLKKLEKHLIDYACGCARCYKKVKLYSDIEQFLMESLHSKELLKQVQLARGNSILPMTVTDKENNIEYQIICSSMHGRMVSELYPLPKGVTLTVLNSKGERMQMADYIR